MRIFSFSQSLLNLLLNPPSRVCVRVRVSGNNSIGWLWYVLPMSVCPSACADTSPDSLCVPCAMLHPVHGTQRRSHGAIQGKRSSVLIPKPPAEPVKSSGMRSDWYDGQCVLQRASRRAELQTETHDSRDDVSFPPSQNNADKPSHALIYVLYLFLSPPSRRSSLIHLNVAGY